MVSSRSKKATPKHTYAERVLKAFSQAQREHRRHAIHFATLRAQVKKNAQAQKDPLGPQWSSWVKKAVHKLEDEGILEHAEQSGSVALTPNGKNAIAEARRTLGIPSGTSSRPAGDEDIVWKNVARKASTRSLKRKSHQQGEQSRDQEEEERVPSTPRKKRGKTSLPGSAGRKAISKMTKPELKAELQALQRAHADLVSELEHTLHAPETDTTQKLEAELKQRQEEVDAIRKELAEVRRLSVFRPSDRGDESALNMLEFPSSPAFGTPMSLPSRPYRPGAIPDSLRAPRVVRTHSGSLISRLSKQPTPAPTTPGSDHHELLAADADVFGDGEAQPDVPDLEVSQAPEVSTEVPPAELAPGVDQGEQIPHRENLSSFDSAARRALEETVSRLQIQLSASEADISARDARILVVEEEIEDLRNAVREKEAAREAIFNETRTLLIDCENQVKGFQKDFQDMTAQLNVAAPETSRTDSSLKSSLFQLYAHLLITKTAVSEMQAHETQLTDQVSNLHDENEQLHVRVATLEEGERSLSEQLVEATSAKDGLRSELEEARNSSLALKAELEEKEQLARSLINARDEALLTISRATAERNVLMSEISAIEAAISLSFGRRRESISLSEHVKALIVAKEQKGIELEARVREVEAANEGLRKAMDVVRSENVEQQARIVSLTQSLATAEASLADLKAKVLLLGGRHDELESILASKENELEVARSALNAGKKRMAEVEAELEDTTERVREAEAAKEMDEATIQSLKETFETLRHAQMANLAEFDDRVSHSSPAPKSRRSSRIPIE